MIQLASEERSTNSWTAQEHSTHISMILIYTYTYTHIHTHELSLKNNANRRKGADLLAEQQSNASQNPLVGVLFRLEEEGPDKTRAHTDSNLLVGTPTLLGLERWAFIHAARVALLHGHGLEVQHGHGGCQLLQASVLDHA